MNKMQKARLATLLDEADQIVQSAGQLLDRAEAFRRDLREWVGTEGLNDPRTAAQRPAGGSEPSPAHSDDPENVLEPPSGRAPGAAYAGLPHRFQPWTCVCGLDYQAKVHHNG